MAESWVKSYILLLVDFLVVYASNEEVSQIEYQTYIKYRNLLNNYDHFSCFTLLNRVIIILNVFQFYISSVGGSKVFTFKHSILDFFPIFCVTISIFHFPLYMFFCMHLNKTVFLLQFQILLLLQVCNSNIHFNKK